MWIQIIQRFLILCLMLMIVSVIAFLLPYMAGGDPARTILFRACAIRRSIRMRSRPFG